MDKNINQQNSNDLPRQGGGPWWKPAVELMSQVSTWIVVPIILAVIFGKMLDARFGTKPTLFLVCIALSFLLSCYGIVKVIRKYNEKLKEIEREAKNKQDKI